jgi:hypothetical protein
MADENRRPDFALTGLPERNPESEAPSSRVVDLARNAVSQLEPELAPLMPVPMAQELGELLSVEDVALRMGCDEEQVREMIAARKLLAHGAPGKEPCVPAFQLAGEPPSLTSAVAGSLELLNSVCTETRTLLAWFCAPKDELSGRTPAAWIRDGGIAEPVLLAARRDAARLA